MQTDAPATSTRPLPHGSRAITLISVSLAAVIGFGAYSCQSLAGGPVRSDAEYRERVAQTKEAGQRTVRALTPAPEEASEPPGRTLDETAETDGSTSCVDDLGVDDDGVTRDEPVYHWELTFTGTDDYRAAVGHLRRQWKRQGLTVKDVPAPGKGEPGAGLPGVTATDDQGIELSFRPDWYSGKPVVRADGGCVRHAR
ncbi:hypothetical protein [Streptomyces sp. NPDC001843]|uniref:hypothetical protein n=1 Tax=Streptomyces sp. NPDC001843 TaxID=3364617 RepID=UPI0036CFE509